MTSRYLNGAGPAQRGFNQCRANLRYAATEENIKLTAQRRNITEEEPEYLKEKIQKEKDRMEEMYEKVIKEATADRRGFDRVIAEGKKQANIEWDKVSFVRLEVKPSRKTESRWRLLHRPCLPRQQFQNQARRLHALPKTRLVLGPWP